MQLAAGLADQLGQARLDVHVDVFERGAERELAGLDLALDAVQAGEDGVALRRAHDAGLREHRRVRLRPRDVLRVQPLVEADRGVYLLHERRRALGEVTAPESDCAVRRRASWVTMRSRGWRHAFRLLRLQRWRR